jgi:energy-coupling factor transport system ATP-binding protein
MGERQRVALASVLALEPHLLLLDEPFAQLDDPGKAKLRQILELEKRRGLGVVIAEHRAEHLGGLADAVAVIPALEKPATSLPELPEQAAKDRGSPSGPILAVDSLRFSENGRTVLRDVSFTIERGEKVLLIGDNGSGKTTLMSCLTGGLAPTGGEVRLAGQALPPARELVGRVGYLMQNPERCLFELSVEDELSFTMRRLAQPRAFVSDQAKALAAHLGFDDALARSPMQLSFGQKHATALASVAAALPDLLLLDEPLTGLDNDFCLRMLGLVNELCQRHGMAVLMAAHDETCAAWAHRVLRLSDGQVTQDAGERT